MPVCTLSDLRKEDEQRTRDMERGETSPLLRAETRSTDSNVTSGESTSVRRTTALRVLELLFPYFRLRSLLLLISIADWAVFITTLAMDSEMPLVPSRFGMMGVEIAELALSWQRLQHRDRLLTNIVSFFVLMGLFAFTLNGGSIDQMGHLGGLICGFSLGILFNKDMLEKPGWWKLAFWGSIFLLIALPGSCIPVLFAVDRGCSA
ncbi:rhomboid family domain-containing protein, putative [Eimeria maxima]|uniref:Rhomboid family domain-containing protein, putative n=1 Tax=Eimeria maxima TaxID=5804 RepID=U6M788_EIMMA|nr:rhomboid family domain-containing protein, putative [Eimeria maxima]CDJ58339.1 rhomboid family domain-containing protein, putative [Eimeria maxima]